MQRFKRLLNANFHSMMLFWKFGILLAYGFLWPINGDLFGLYTLGLGLTNTFFIFAGLRARFFVIRSIQSIGQFRDLTLIILVLGVLAFIVVALLNSASQILTVILLISLTKFIEMFTDACTSFLQNTFGRDVAFRVLNQHSLGIALVFTILLPFGLEIAVFGEACILLLLLIKQWRLIAPTLKDRAAMARSGFLAVLQGGVEFTLAATLNAAQFTMFLYYCQTALSLEQAQFMAKVFAMQAIASRLITGNNFYFKDEMTGGFEKFRSMILILLAVFWILAFVVFFAATQTEILPGFVALVLAAGLFTIVNVTNVLLRQHKLLVSGPRDLIGLHLCEVAALICVIFFLEPDVMEGLVIFTTLRLLRNLYLIHVQKEKTDG